MRTQRKTSKRLKRGKTRVNESRLVKWKLSTCVVNAGPGFKYLSRHSLDLFSVTRNSTHWFALKTAN